MGAILAYLLKNAGYYIPKILEDKTPRIFSEDISETDVGNFDRMIPSNAVALADVPDSATHIQIRILMWAESEPGSTCRGVLSTPLGGMSVKTRGSDGDADSNNMTMYIKLDRLNELHIWGNTSSTGSRIHTHATVIDWS